MWRKIVAVLRVLLLISAVSASAAQAPSVYGTPSFYKDVLPLLQQHCQNCPRPGEVAPMAFTDYSHVRPWAKAILQAVLLRKMPPWLADPEVGKFANDRSLPESAIETITAWVDAGAPAGNPKDAPPPIAWVDGWQIGKPDLVIEMPAEIEIPASGVFDYQYMIVPTNFTEDTWVQLAEARPTGREHLHHMEVSVREPGSLWMRNEPVGVAFTSKPGDDGGVGAQGETLTGYGPGAIPEVLGPGRAKLIKAGSDLVFQLHYAVNGKPGRDRSRVGLILAREKPRERVTTLAAANVRFAIPPGDPDFRVDARLKLHADATLIDLLPHMHLRGKSFEFRAIYPDGRKETLLLVPHYDFDWQLTYYLDQPKRLPKGTIIECTAHFDNSANNPRNPDASKLVRFGPQSWDEMMIGFFEVAVDPEITLRDLLFETGAGSR
jgi:hypothetical protein